MSICKVSMPVDASACIVSVIRVGIRMTVASTKCGLDMLT